MSPNQIQGAPVTCASLPPGSDPDRHRYPPGRAVDIVMAAARKLDLPVYSVEVNFAVNPGVHLIVLGGISEHQARTVYAVLGVTGVAISARYSNPPQARMHANVPALDTTLHVYVDLPDVPPAPEAADPAALVAEVDAARAADLTAEDPHAIADAAPRLAALLDQEPQP